MKLVRESLDILSPKSDKDIEAGKKELLNKIGANLLTVRGDLNAYEDNEEYVKEIDAAEKYLKTDLTQLYIVDDNTDWEVFDSIKTLLELPDDYKHKWGYFQGAQGKWYVSPDRSYAYLYPAWQGDSDAIIFNKNKLLK